jgi:hypothetical protein
MTNMKLPSEEVEVLVKCSGDVLRARVQALREAGWTLASIADAWNPPKQRSSIRLLATTPTKTPLPIVSSPPSPSSSLTAAERKNSTTPAARRHRRARRFYTEESPKISKDDSRTLKRLAPLARRYRARANPNGAYAVANTELTGLCIVLYRNGVSVQELAATAGVTYRAMARRLGVGK